MKGSDPSPKPSPERDGPSEFEVRRLNGAGGEPQTRLQKMVVDTVREELRTAITRDKALAEADAQENYAEILQLREEVTQLQDEVKRERAGNTTRYQALKTNGETLADDVTQLQDGLAKQTKKHANLKETVKKQEADRKRSPSATEGEVLSCLASIFFGVVALAAMYVANGAQALVVQVGCMVVAVGAIIIAAAKSRGFERAAKKLRKNV